MKTTLSLRKSTLVAVLVMTFSLATQAQSKGSGNLVKQDREVSMFTEIEAGSAFEIILEQGEPLKVTVETDDNYLEKITTTVRDNRLVVESSGLKNPTAMKVYITMPDLTSLDLSGAARLDSKEEFTVNNLDIDASGASKVNMNTNAQQINSDISGAAKVNLEGKTNTLDADVSGAALLEALKFVAQSVTINISGAAKARVYAINELNAELSGAGNLAYYDDPDLKKLSQQGTYNFQFQNPEIPDEEDSEGILSTTESGDSTLISIGDIKVQVIEGNPTKVTIGNNELEVDDEGNVDFKRNRQDRFDGHWGGFEMGINGYLNSDMGFDMPAGYEYLDLRYEKSTNVALNLIEQNFNLIRNHFGITTGLGIEWQNYRFDNNVIFTTNDDGVDGGFYEGDKNYTKSKLVVNYLNVPVLFEYQTNRFSKKNSFHIGAGLLTGLRIGSHTKMVYQDGEKQKEKYHDDDGFDINPFSFRLMARIGWGKINLFANYSLNTMFEEGRGPELYPFVAGITLVSW